MKNERAEKLIKEKVNTADTMPGVSFDMSAAWDKMEYLLENKPKKNRKVLYYWLAAAASLLLLVTIMIENGSTENRMVKNIEPVRMNVDTTKVSPVAALPAINTDRQTLSVKYRSVSSQKSKIRSVVPIKPTAVVVPDVNRVRAFPEAKKDTVIESKASPAIAVKAKMKEIHINDLVEEDYEIERIRRENRMASEGFRLFRPQTGNVISNNTNQENTYPLHNALKTIFN